MKELKFKKLNVKKFCKENNRSFELFNLIDQSQLKEACKLINETNKVWKDNQIDKDFLKGMLTKLVDMMVDEQEIE